MTPFEVYIVPLRQVESLTSTPPIPRGDLDNYLSVRPGILDDGHCDIFQPNCRSDTQAYTRFDLFKIVDHVESGTVVVFPFWMELFHAYGLRHHIATCLNWLNATYPGNPCVVQWNSDTDCSTMLEFQDLPSNLFVLQFNTSRRSESDIVLPFWNVSTRQQWDVNTDRRLRGGYIGYVGNVKVRQAMARAFDRKDGWVIADTTEVKMAEKTYLSFMQEMDFALCPRGGGLSSYRFYEALQCGCIPILFADDVALPYPNLPWGDLIVRIPEADSGNFEFVNEVLPHIDVKIRRQRIAEVRERFTLAGVQREIHSRITEYLE